MCVCVYILLFYGCHTSFIHWRIHNSVIIIIIIIITLLCYILINCNGHLYRTTVRCSMEFELEFIALNTYLLWEWRDVASADGGNLNAVHATRHLQNLLKCNL